MTKRPETGPNFNAQILEAVATQKDLEAAVSAFSAALIRGQAGEIGRASDAAHAALQAHLDATATMYALHLRAWGWR